MNKVQAKRLLNVAKALRESQVPKAFTMSCFVNTEDYLGDRFGSVPEGFCGTPGCALGHYGARPDLQKLMEIKVYADNDACLVYKRQDPGEEYDVSQEDRRVQDHFGIDLQESHELFDFDGCGEAKTPKAAAQYIERFVKHKMNKAKPRR